MYYNVKFFGSTKPKEQIKLVRMTIEAKDRSVVEDLLRRDYRYKVINGLKINQCKDN